MIVSIQKDAQRLPTSNFICQTDLDVWPQLVYHHISSLSLVTAQEFVTQSHLLIVKIALHQDIVP